LVDAIESILSKMEKDYKIYKEMERRKIEAELKDIVFDMLTDLLYQSSDFNKYVDLVARREIDPYKAAESIVKSKIKV